MKISRTNKLNKAFTLLEVLIATSIFAVVMVMTTGVISQSATYQNKTKALRDSSEEVARISEMISRDLKAASGPFNLCDQSSKCHLMKNGVAVLKSNGTFLPDLKTPASPVRLSVDDFSSTTYPASVLIINLGASAKFRIYYSQAGSASTPGKIYAKTYSDSYLKTNNWLTPGISSGYETLSITTPAPQKKNLLTTNLIADGNVISTGIAVAAGDNLLDTTAGFTGYTASDVSGASLIQSYINFYVHSRTDGYDSLPPTDRAENYLRSMVTMRNYGS